MATAPQPNMDYFAQASQVMVNLQIQMADFEARNQELQAQIDSLRETENEFMVKQNRLEHIVNQIDEITTDFYKTNEQDFRVLFDDYSIHSWSVNAGETLDMSVNVIPFEHEDSHLQLTLYKDGQQVAQAGVDGQNTPVMMIYKEQVEAAAEYEIVIEGGETPILVYPGQMMFEYRTFGHDHLML